MQFSKLRGFTQRVRLFYIIIIIIILSLVCWALILLFLLGALCQVLKEENDDRLSLTNDINCCSCRYRIF